MSSEHSECECGGDREVELHKLTVVTFVMMLNSPPAAVNLEGQSWIQYYPCFLLPVYVNQALLSHQILLHGVLDNVGIIERLPRGTVPRGGKKSKQAYVNTKTTNVSQDDHYTQAFIQRKKRGKPLSLCKYYYNSNDHLFSYFLSEQKLPTP